MFFVYGGGYEYGTQLKMDQARLGDVADIVLVAVNYRYCYANQVLKNVLSPSRHSQSQSRL